MWGWGAEAPPPPLDRNPPEPMTLRNLPLAAVAFALVAALGSPAAHAQTAPAIGYTDYELILVQMPQFRQVQQQIQEQAEADQQALGLLQSTVEQRLEQKGNELQNRLQGAQGPVTDDARQRLLQQLQQEAVQFEMEQRQEFEQERQRRVQALSRRETELLQPLYDQLQTAINAVAEQRNLAMVISSRLSGEPVLLYAGPTAVDITTEVMSRLGISMQSSN
jgi:outer membrane protein